MRNFRDGRLALSVALRHLGRHQGSAVAPPPTPGPEPDQVGARRQHMWHGADPAIAPLLTLETPGPMVA
jgi:hypothetical protein